MFRDENQKRRQLEKRLDMLCQQVWGWTVSVL